METKKSKRANLEKYRTIFLQIGFILTLSAILFAFEWKASVTTEELTGDGTKWKDIEEFPPPTMPEAKPPAKVEPPAFELDIVENQSDIEDVNMEHLISEIGEGEPIIIQEFDDNRDDDVVDEPVVFAEFMPAFQGNDVNSFRNYIAKNIEFPVKAASNGIKGTVFVEFVVDKDGSVSDVRVIRPVHPIVDEAVINVIQNSPKWEPGINNGHYVRVKFTIGIKFDLI